MAVLRWLTAPTYAPWPATPGSGKLLPAATSTRHRGDHPTIPDITEILDQLRGNIEPSVRLDGTLVRTDRIAARTQTGNHLWYARLSQGLWRWRATSADHTGYRSSGARLNPRHHHRAPMPYRLSVPSSFTGAAHVGRQELHRGGHRHQDPR